jgi:hypothetical protein
LEFCFSCKRFDTRFLRDPHYVDLAAIYVNISRADRPPVLKSEVARLDWNLENTPPQLNRGAIPANSPSPAGFSPGLNGSNGLKLRNRMCFSAGFLSACLGRACGDHFTGAEFAALSY